MFVFSWEEKDLLVQPTILPNLLSQYIVRINQNSIDRQSAKWYENLTDGTNHQIQQQHHRHHRQIRRLQRRMNLTPQPRKNKWYERARPSTMMENSSISPIRNNRDTSQMNESHLNMSQNMNGSEILSNSIHSVTHFNNDFILPQSVNLSQINQVSQNNSYNNSLIQSQSTLFKSQKISNQNEKSRFQKTPDARDLKSSKRGLKSISDIDDRQLNNSSYRPMNVAEMKRNRLLDLVVTKNSELVKMAVIKQAFRQLKKNYNKYQMFTIAFNKLHRIIRYHPLEIMSYSLKQIKMYSPPTFGRSSALASFTKKKGVDDFKRLQINTSYQEQEAPNRSVSHCKEDLRDYLNLYDTPQQKIPKQQFAKAFACMRLAEVEYLIEDKLFKLKALFFIKLITQHSNYDRVPITENNGYSVRRTQSKSPIAPSRAVNSKASSALNTSNNLLPNNPQQQKWKTTSQILGRLNSSILGGASLMLDKRPSSVLDSYKLQGRNSKTQQHSESSLKSFENDKSTQPNIRQSNIQKSVNITKSNKSSNMNYLQDTRDISPNESFNIQKSSLSPSRSRVEMISMRKRNKKKPLKDFSTLLVFYDIYNKRMREYFNAIRAHYIRKQTYSPTKSRMSGIHQITPIDRSFSPFTHSHLLDMSQDQKNQSMFSSPAFKNNDNYESVKNNNNKNMLHPTQFLQEAGIRQTVSYLENTNNKNQLFESIDLKKEFIQESEVWRPYQQDQDSIVEQQKMTVKTPIITNLNEIRPMLFTRHSEEFSDIPTIQVKKQISEKKVTIQRPLPVRTPEQEELRDRRIQKGMEKLQWMLEKKKEVNQIHYVDIYVKYEMVSYMLSRVLMAVRTRNLIGAFMKISSYGYNKYQKKEKIDRMFYHFECISFQKKRAAFFQLQRAAINNKARETTLKSLMHVFLNKEMFYKKTALTNMKSMVGVSRTFVKGKFSQYHFLAMKFQDIFRKCAQRKKREAFNSLSKWNTFVQNFINSQRQNHQRRQFMLKQIFTLLVRNKLRDAFSSIQISSKSSKFQNVRKNAAIRSLISFVRNKQRLQIESAFLSIQQEQHISLSKEKLRLEKQTNALKHEQSKSLRNKAIAFRIAGILQKLIDKRQSDAIKQMVFATFKQTELQQQKLQKLTRIFSNILNRKIHSICGEAFSQIKWTTSSKFIKTKMGASAINNFLQNKLKENLKSALTNLKSHRLADAYQSRQRRTLSKSFYLMLCVKLKGIFENRKKQNTALALTKMKGQVKKHQLMSGLANTIEKFQLRNVFQQLKKRDSQKQNMAKAIQNLQKMQNTMEKENLFFSWNRLLRQKLAKKQNTSKALVVIMTLQNIFKNQKRNALSAVKQHVNTLQIKQKAANTLAMKLCKLEKNQLIGAMKNIMVYGEVKTKLIKRFVSILRAPYYNVLKQSFDTIRAFDIETYEEVKQNNQFVVQQIQTIIQSDNRYVSPLSKRQMMQQQYEQEKESVNGQMASGTRLSFNNGNNASMHPNHQLMASPSTDRTIKLNNTTPFKLSAIKVQQPIFLSQEEIAQKQRQRYSYIANILNRKSKLALKRQLANALENIYLVYKQKQSLEHIISNISEKQQREYLSTAFTALKDTDRKKQLAISLVTKVSKVFKNAALLPHYLHFMNILKENSMSKIYVQTYQNLEISEAKKRALQATLKQGDLQLMNEVLQTVNNINNQQRQAYTKMAFILEQAQLNTKKEAFLALKRQYQNVKLSGLMNVFERYQSQFSQQHLQSSFNQIQEVGSVLHKSKKLTVFCQKISMILSKKLLQQKYEGLFAIIEQSNSEIEKYNFSEIKKNALGKILMKQRQKHLFSSFFLWKRINKEYNLKKNLESDNENNDIYIEVMSFLNQRKNFENVIDSELKKIQSSALKSSVVEGDKKPYYKGIQSANKDFSRFGNSSAVKENTALKESDKNRSFKTTSSSFNVTSFYPESTGAHTQEKKYDSGHYALDSYQYQLQSQKKQLYNQFMNQSKSPEQTYLDNNSTAFNNNQFIPTGVPILEEDDESAVTSTQTQYQNGNQNKIPVNQQNFDKIVDKFYAEGVADFSFTEQEH